MNGFTGSVAPGTNPLAQILQALQTQPTQPAPSSTPPGPSAGDQSNLSPEAQMEEFMEILEMEIAAVQAQLQAAQASNDPSQSQLQDELSGLTNELQALQGGGNSGSGMSPSSMFDSPGGAGGAGSDAGGSPGDAAGGGGGTGGGGTGQGVDPTPISATGNGSQAVQIANSQMGQLAQNVNLPNYSHAGGNTNDCADFVSACVADAGTFQKSGGDVNVEQFQSDLQKQGWQAVPQGQAKPGDVAIILGGGVQHTELVANNGATQCIGSNGTSQEQVSTDNPSSWSSHVAYYRAAQQVLNGFDRLSVLTHEED